MSPWLSALVALGLLALAGLASAQGAVRDLTLYWFPTPGAETYVLYRTRTGIEERVTIGAGTAQCGLLTAVVPFLRNGAYRLELAAVNSAGVEGPRSKNVLAVPSCRAKSAPGCAP